MRDGYGPESERDWRSAVLPRTGPCGKYIQPVAQKALKSGQRDLCRGLKLLSSDMVAIDGSKFKAVNSPDRNFTAGKIGKRQQQIEESVQRYLDMIETADRTSPTGFDVKTVRLYEKIALLRQRMRELEQIKEQLKKEPDRQMSLTDPDSRSMTSGGKRTGTVGYNVQTVVDTKHHLIVEHEVTNFGSDHGQLSWMALSAKSAIGNPPRAARKTASAKKPG